MRCIKCGNELSMVFENQKPSSPLIGYKCPICKLKDENGNEFDLQWTLAEHKDNQHWAVRHIRALEQQVQQQQQQIDLLVKKLEGI